MHDRSAIAERRAERTRTLLETRGWRALVAYGNAWRAEYLRYVSDFAILEGHGVAVVEPARVTLFLESPYEAERAETEARGVAVRLVPDVFAAAVTAVEGLNGAIAAAPAAFTPLALRNGLPQAVDASDALADLLMYKAEEEVDAVARAAALADEGYAVFRAAVRPGRREYEIIGEVEAFLRSRGCPEQFVIMAAGNTDVRGMRAPSDRRIVAGDVVITEITPAIDGYFAQLCRTLVVGEPNAAQRAAFDIFAKATEAGIALVRPGATAAEIAKAENDVFRAAGLGQYTTSQYTRVRGHGMGLNLDGGPSILEDVTMPLAPGMTLIVHPNTYHPEVGYMVLGDALAVTQDGHRRLASTPLELFSVSA